MAGNGDQRRRSARISALDTRKTQRHQEETSGDNQHISQQPFLGNTSNILLPQQEEQKEVLRHKSRGRKKKNLISSVSHTSHEQPEESAETLKQAVNSTNHAQSASKMPEKKLLKLVIDILQRKDTQGLFAEPVDPAEVEDYYEIIKDPMDFGTWREKLEQGVYETLDQFEHDAFLIFSNAMHFNASNTIYYKQARAIQELAIQVFYTLRGDPEKLESGFSVMRSCRRPKSEVRISKISPNAKYARHGGMTVKVKSRGRKSLNSLSNTRGTRGRRASTSIPRDFGDRDGYFTEAERCHTYRPWNSFLNENECIISDVSNHPKHFVPIIEHGMRYKESLMSFAKDLGPTAQMVSNRKLQQCMMLEQQQAIVPVCRSFGSEEMGQHRGDSGPHPPQNGSLEFANDHEAYFNSPTTSGENRYLAMLLDPGLSDNEPPHVLPQSGDLESGSPSSSSSRKMDSNNLNPSSWVLLQSMLRELNATQTPSSSYTSKNSVSMVQPSLVVEPSQTSLDSHGVNNAAQTKTLVGQIGGTTIAPPPSFIIGLNQDEYTTRGRRSIYEQVSNLSHHPNLSLHEKQRWSLNQRNQTNLLSSQWFGGDIQNNVTLMGGASSSDRGSLSCQQPDFNQLMGWNEPSLGSKAYVHDGVNERGITREANHLSSWSDSCVRVQSNSSFVGLGSNQGTQLSNLSLSSYYKDAGSGTGSSAQTNLGGQVSEGWHGKYHNGVMDEVKEQNQYGIGWAQAQAQAQAQTQAQTQTQTQAGASVLLDWSQNQHTQSHLQSRDVYNMERGISNENGMRRSSSGVSHQYYNGNGTGTGNGNGNENGSAVDQQSQIQTLDAKAILEQMSGGWGDTLRL